MANDYIPPKVVLFEGTLSEVQRQMQHVVERLPTRSDNMTVLQVLGISPLVNDRLTIVAAIPAGVDLEDIARFLGPISHSL